MKEIDYVVEGVSDYRKAVGELVPYIQHLIKWRHQPEWQSGSWTNTISSGVRVLYLTKTRQKSIWNRLMDSTNMDAVYVDARIRAIDEMKTHRYSEVPPMRDQNIYNLDFLSDPAKVQKYLDSLPCPKETNHDIIPKEYCKDHPFYKR